MQSNEHDTYHDAWFLKYIIENWDSLYNCCLAKMFQPHKTDT